MTAPQIPGGVSLLAGVVRTALARSQTARILTGACIFVCLAWSLLVVALWATQSQLVFMTSLSRSYTARLDPTIFEEHPLINGDGLPLSSVLLTHNTGSNGYWILFCPPAGASTRVHRIQEHLRQLWTLGYNVLGFDYRGFGNNRGRPTEDGLYADASAAYEYLVDTRRVPPSRIILAGRSLGSAVAVDLATRADAAGLLLLSPIDSVPAAAARLYPWVPVRWLSRYRFDSRSKAGAIALPVVLIHGTNDRYLPLAEARALLAEFRGPTEMVVTGGGHHHAGFVTLAELHRPLRKFWPPQP
jgi:uncharacterized protein